MGLYDTDETVKKMNNKGEVIEESIIYRALKEGKELYRITAIKGSGVVDIVENSTNASLPPKKFNQKQLEDYIDLLNRVQEYINSESLAPPPDKQL